MNYLKLFFFVQFCMLLGAAGIAFAEVDNGSAPGTWIGAHSRLVWVQDQGDGADTFAHRSSLMLYGYDSEDGKGERPLAEKVGNYFKPFFTPDGEHVIYSDRRARKIYLLNWESGKVKSLGSGVAVAAWEDPEPSRFLRRKTVWVYCFDGRQPENKYGTSQPMYRFPLHSPKKKELIWNSTNMGWSNVQVSRDGSLLGGLFPWPHGGILTLEDKQYKRFGRGCWTSLSPDNSKLFWIFDGLHRNVQIHDVQSGENWKVNINNAPGIGGFEVYHPRWTNHPRYFVMTGPYEKGDGGNKIGGGGEKVEVYVGRFDTKARRVEAYLQLTHNGRADFYPDLWVEGGNTANLADAVTGKTVTRDLAEWPAARDSLLFVWENMNAANQLPKTGALGFYQCNVTLRGEALFTRDFSLQADNGWGDTGDAGAKLGPLLAKGKNATLELLVAPKRVQDASVFSLQEGDSEFAAVRQEQDSLVFESALHGESKRISWPGVFVEGEPVHLIFLLSNESVELLKNGKSLGEKKIKLHLSKVKQPQMILGDKQGNWQGTLSTVAVYNRFLTAQEISENSSYALSASTKAKPAKRITVEAVLDETTEIPAPDSIGAYRRALVVNSYTVRNVVDGAYDEDKIVVAEWAVLDRQIIKSYADNPGVERLVLEKFDDHPELEGERQMMDIFEPDLTMYYRLKE